MPVREIIDRWNCIKVKVLVYGIIISIGPLVSLAYFYVQEAEEDLLASFQLRNTDLVNQVSTDIERLVTEIETKVILASNLHGNKLYKEDVVKKEKVLFTLMRDIPPVEEITLYDHKGNPITKVSRREVVNLEKISTLPASLIGREGVVKSYLAADGRTMVSLVIPCIDLFSQEIVGTFAVEVNLRPIVDTVTARVGAEQGEIFVVNSEGKLIGHEDFSQVLRQTSVTSSLAVRQFLDGKEESSQVPLRYETFSGEEVLGVYSPINKVGWGAVVEIPVNEAYKPIYSLRLKMVLGTLIVVMGVISIGIHLALRFTKPIEILEQGAKQVAKGQLDVILPKSTTDEIGRLVDSFNHMIRQLKLKREMEKFIIQTEKMAALGQMSAGLAHEINNPLATVSVYAEDLMERINEEDIQELYKSGELTDYLQVIRNQTERGKKITTNLLTFARKPRGFLADINVNEVIEDSLALLNYRFKKEDIKVSKYYTQDIPIVQGDLSSFQQVLLNIITNALDAMESISNAKLKVITEKTEENVVIKIIDNGIGIAKEEQDKVFDPFYTTKPVGKGTGLGLSICYGIIQEMKGQIRIDSELGKETTVVILLPLVNLVAEEGE